jgi:hypothetical protein
VQGQDGENIEAGYQPAAGARHATEAPGVVQRTLRIAAALLSAAAGFLLVSTLLRPLVPWPSDDRLAERAAWFERHADSVDVLVFGSSTFARGFDASAFDERLAELGLPLRTQSFGTPGMNQYELVHSLERLLADCSPGLRFVLVEQLLWDPGELIWADNRYGDRAVHWHGWRETLAVAGQVWGIQRPLEERILSTSLHAQHALWRLANLGQGPRIVIDLLGAGQDANDVPTRLAQLNAAPEATGGARERFLRSEHVYRKQIRSLPNENAQPMQLPHRQRARMLRQIEAVRGCGAEPIFVVAPVAHPTPAFHRLAETGALAPLLAYNRPGRYPELYALDRRIDAQHLNSRGAREWSRILADDVAALARKRPR